VVTQLIRIEGYAIVSADGMLADRYRKMPDALKIDADVRFFNQALDRAVLVVHGRNSHEQQPSSDRRPRLIVTHRVAALTEHPSIPLAQLWNPAGMSFAEACRAIGVTEGMAAVTGGAEVFRLFLDIWFDAFHLSRAGKARLPGGRPVFPEVPAVTPEQVLASHGLRPGPYRCLTPRRKLHSLPGSQHLVTEIALLLGNPHTSYCR
jgi:dihydrofolate reductase